MPAKTSSQSDAIAVLLRRADDLLGGDEPDVAGARAAIAAARQRCDAEAASGRGRGRGSAGQPTPGDSADDLLSTIAHELRNPVSPMVFQVEYMMMQVRQRGESVASSWVLEQLEGLRRRLDAFVISLDRLLDASEIHAGTLRIQREPVDAAELVRELAAAAEDQARAGGSSIHVVAGDEPVVGHWDRLRLEQAVRNLVSNAIRYAAGGDIELRVEADEARVQIVVRDEGPGIPPDKLDQIFDRFARASAKSGGFGIGLWLVKRISQALGGDVHVESRPGEGACFYISLPREPCGRDATTT